MLLLNRNPTRRLISLIPIRVTTKNVR